MRNTLTIVTASNRARGIQYSGNTDEQVIIILDENGSTVVHCGEDVDSEVLRQVIDSNNESSVIQESTLKPYGLDANSLFQLIMRKKAENNPVVTAD